MIFGSKWLHIALTTIHLHEEVKNHFLGKRWIEFKGNLFNISYSAYKPIVTEKK